MAGNHLLRNALHNWTVPLQEYPYGYSQQQECLNRTGLINNYRETSLYFFVIT